MDRLRVELLPASLEALQEQWRELAETADTPFATYEWATAWWRSFGSEPEALRLAACRRPDGSLAALLPLYAIRRGPVRVARFIGHGPGDELGPVSHPDDRPAALEALREAFSTGTLDADVLVAERLAGGRASEAALGGLAIQRERNPGIDLGASSWEGFLKERSSNFRSQVRRRERALLRDHSATFRLATSPETAEADLTTIFALHDARWGAAGSGALAGARGAFHLDFGMAAARRGWLRLWLLEIDGRPVAGWYGLRYAGRDWYYQSGRDPAFDDSSIGSVLLMHTVREAVQDGMAEYRLLRGGESYKDRLATHDHPLTTAVLGSGPATRAAVGLIGLVGPQRSRVRSRLKRAAG